MSEDVKKNTEVTKDNKSGYVIWCAINTCLILIVFMYCYINNNIGSETIRRVDDVELRVEEQSKMKPDTVVINVNNYLNIPKTIKVKNIE